MEPGARISPPRWLFGAWQRGSQAQAAVTAAFARAADHPGAALARHTGIVGTRQSQCGAHAVSTTGGDTSPCGQLVRATGGWSAQLGAGLGLSLPGPVKPQRGEVKALQQPSQPLRHILFGEGIYLSPRRNGTILVRTTRTEGTFDMRVPAGGLRWLLRRALPLAPRLEHVAVADYRAGIRPKTPDGRPILGRVQEWDNVVLATGHNGFGITLSAVTGQAVAHLITTGETPALIQPFALDRFGQDTPKEASAAAQAAWRAAQVDPPSRKVTRRRLLAAPRGRRGRVAPVPRPPLRRRPRTTRRDVVMTGEETNSQETEEGQRESNGRGTLQKRARGGRPRKQRGWHEGTISEIRPSTFRGQITLGGKRHSVSGRNREDVLRGFDELRRRYHLFGEGGLDDRARHITLADYLQAWLEGKRGTVEHQTWRVHEINVMLHLCPTLGRLKLAHLTAEHLRSLYGRLQPPEGHLAPKSVREVHGTIRQALQQATVVDRLLPHNVALAVRPPKLPSRHVRSRQYVLSPEQLARFWAAVKDERLYALWRLAAFVPSRSGELRGLQWEDFDERHRLLVIRRNLQRSSDAGRLLRTKEPKTAAGTRAITIDDALVEVLRQHRHRQVEERRCAGADWVDHGLIFCSRYGTPILRDNLQRAFRTCLQRADLPTHYRVHDLRHTAVSCLLAAGIPLAEVSQMAGHANPAVTSAMYAHVVNRTRTPATTQLAEFYRQATTGPATLEGADTTDATDAAGRAGATPAPGAGTAAATPAAPAAAEAAAAAPRDLPDRAHRAASPSAAETAGA